MIMFLFFLVLECVDCHYVLILTCFNSGNFKLVLLLVFLLGMNYGLLVTS